MNAPVIKGYCPGALTPMMSGDGLLVRVRPFGGRLTHKQAKGIADLAQTYGNGLLDVSSRANIQIRGVTKASHPELLDGLRALSLLDPTARAEGQRNVIVTPFWETDDGTQRIATAVTQALTAETAPTLPHKFGIAIDTGAAPVLHNASADIRLERQSGGGLLICADGAPVGRPIGEDDIAQEVLELADWFLENQADKSRMRAVFRRDGSLPHDHFVPPLQQGYRPAPGPTKQGFMAGVAFGQMRADTLAALAEHGALRLTPWRMVLVEGAHDLPPLNGIITDPNDPLLRIVACAGTAGCAQAMIETRGLATALAPSLPTGTILHVSGCTKGCAHPKPAPLTVTGTPNGLSLIRDGRASDIPSHTGLTAAQLTKAI